MQNWLFLPQQNRASTSASPRRKVELKEKEEVPSETVRRETFSDNNTALSLCNIKRKYSAMRRVEDGHGRPVNISGIDLLILNF